MIEGPQPREVVQAMAPYHPPTGGRSGKLRLDFNENTVGCSPKVIEAIHKYLTADHLTVYPEYIEAMADLARFFGVEPTEFAMSNGTDEAIQVLVNTYIDDGDDVLIMRPSYAMYRFYAELAGAFVRELDYRPDDLSFPIDAFLDALRPETKAVMIANPNNPTGTGVKLDEIRLILETAPDAAVLIDEAYFEFCGVTALPWINEYPNLFVSRTFSKVYGMAAMRCGCIFSNEENVKWLRKAQSPYSVNMLAAVAARAAVADEDYVARYVGEVLAARELAYFGLDKLNIPYFMSQANFVLFRAGDHAIEIRDALRAKGVLIRDRSYEIPGCVRVTIGTREQVQRFLTELEALWKKS
ncbi:MAG: histidinol-phosphate transaminase [Acidobacteriota bacterium]